MTGDPARNPAAGDPAGDPTRDLPHDQTSAGPSSSATLPTDASEKSGEEEIELG